MLFGVDAELRALQRELGRSPSWNPEVAEWLSLRASLRSPRMVDDARGLTPARDVEPPPMNSIEHPSAPGAELAFLRMEVADLQAALELSAAQVSTVTRRHRELVIELHAAATARNTLRAELLEAEEGEAAGWQARSRSARLEAWVDEEVKGDSLLSVAAAHIRAIRLPAAFGVWKGARPQQVFVGSASTARRLFSQRSLRGAIGCWRGARARAAHSATAADAAVLLWTESSIANAWTHRWAQSALNYALDVAGAYVACGPRARAFRCFARAAGTARSRALLVENARLAVRRWIFADGARAFARWSIKRQLRRESREIVLRFIKVWANGRRARALRTWEKVLHAKEQARSRLGSTLKRWLKQAMLGAFKQWGVKATGSAERTRALIRGLAEFSGAKSAFALRSWRQTCLVSREVLAHVRRSVAIWRSGSLVCACAKWQNLANFGFKSGARAKARLWLRSGFVSWRAANGRSRLANSASAGVGASPVRRWGETGGPLYRRWVKSSFLRGMRALHRNVSIRAVREKLGGRKLLRNQLREAVTRALGAAIAVGEAADAQIAAAAQGAHANGSGEFGPMGTGEFRPSRPVTAATVSMGANNGPTAAATAAHLLATAAASEPSPFEPQLPSSARHAINSPYAINSSPLFAASSAQQALPSSDVWRRPTSLADPLSGLLGGALGGGLGGGGIGGGLGGGLSHPHPNSHPLPLGSESAFSLTVQNAKREITAAVRTLPPKVRAAFAAHSAISRQNHEPGHPSDPAPDQNYNSGYSYFSSNFFSTFGTNPTDAHTASFRPNASYNPEYYNSNSGYVSQVDPHRNTATTTNDNENREDGNQATCDNADSEAAALFFKCAALAIDAAEQRAGANAELAVELGLSRVLDGEVAALLSQQSLLRSHHANLAAAIHAVAAFVYGDTGGESGAGASLANLSAELEDARAAVASALAEAARERAARVAAGDAREKTQELVLASSVRSTVLRRELSLVEATGLQSAKEARDWRAAAAEDSDALAFLRRLLREDSRQILNAAAELGVRVARAEAGVATASTLLSAFSAAVGDGLLALGNKAGGTLTPAERHLQGLASGVPWAELKLAAAALSEAASLPLAADFQNGSGEDYGAPEAPPWVVGTGASPSRYGARAHERASGPPTPPRSAARAAGAERRESVDQWRQPGEHSLPRQSHAAAPFFKPHGADADSDAGYGGQLYRLGAGAGVGAGYAT